MMQGRIMKGIGGFYYVDTGGSLYECRAKGGFRKDGVKPLVGDIVDIQVLDSEKLVGNIEEILPRKNALIRPACSNVDQAVVIFAAMDPEPNLNLLDRFLVMMEYQDVHTVICFNKTDIASDEKLQSYLDIYQSTGIETLIVSAKENQGMDSLFDLLNSKTTILAGPSGVGKSSIINKLYPKAEMETGSISQKIKRGRHTTRHSELFKISGDTFIMDTPGFTSMRLPEMDKEQLRFYFPEFAAHEGECKFQGCVHINEPDCKVKEELEKQRISASRYENYLQMYDEMKQMKKY
jgi:ribosome biogenesis GTPase